MPSSSREGGRFEVTSRDSGFPKSKISAFWTTYAYTGHWAYNGLVEILSTQEDRTSTSTLQGNRTLKIRPSLTAKHQRANISGYYTASEIFSLNRGKNLLLKREEQTRNEWYVYVFTAYGDQRVRHNPQLLETRIERWRICGIVAPLSVLVLAIFPLRLSACCIPWGLVLHPCWLRTTSGSNERNKRQ